MVQIITRRFPPISPASYISGGEFRGWKQPEKPVSGNFGEFRGGRKTAFLWSLEGISAYTKSFPPPIRNFPFWSDGGGSQP